MKKPRLMLTLLFFLAPFTTRADIPSEWVQKWDEDLVTLEKEIPRIHPDPFRHLSQPEFEAEFDNLSQRLPQLEHHEILMELARIMARIQDGHTRLTLPLAPNVNFFRGHATTKDPELDTLTIRQFPFRFQAAKDGYVLTDITQELPGAQVLLGARLVSIDGQSLEDVLAALRPSIERDNEMGILFRLPQRLVLAEVLKALGIIDDLKRTRWEFETVQGQSAAVFPQPVEANETVPWLSLGKIGPDALGEKEPFELSLWPEKQTLYLNYREVDDGPNERIVDLALRLQALLNQEEFEKLVIDLRENRGGDNSLGLPLLHALIRSPDLQKPGNLVVLIGPKTFSAAMMFAVDLEKHLPVFFVGQPTGSSPNHFGDSKRLRLPNTGLTIRVSSRWWQYSHPLEQRTWIEPHVTFEPTVDDIRTHRDRALEWVMALNPPKSSRKIVGTWVGDLRYRMDSFGTTLVLRETRSGLEGTLRFDEEPEQAIPLESLKIDSGWLSFQFQAPPTLQIEAYEHDDYLIGTMQDRGRGGVFVLRRVKTPEALENPANP